MTKYQRNLLLLQLRDFKRKFDTGRNAFSNTYTGIHSALTVAAEELELFLEGLADTAELKENELKLLGEGLDKVRVASENYIKAKRDEDHYALAADGKIKRATGDKRVRLSAADAIGKICADRYQDVEKQLGEELENDIIAPPQHQSLSMNLEALTRDDRYIRKKRGAKAEMQRAEGAFADAKAVYDTKFAGIKRDKEYRHEMRKAFHYHRDTIMNFDSDESFMKNYEKYRLDIYKTVAGYRKLEDLRDADQDGFRAELKAMGLTQGGFQDMEDKINELDMIGQYMDTRAKLLQNPAYINLKEDTEKGLKKKGAQDLLGAGDLLINDDDKKAMYEQMAALKEMETFGIRQKGESTRNEVNGKKNRVEEGGITTTFAAFTAYEDHGKKFEKGAGAKKNFANFFSIFKPSNFFKKNINASSSDGTTKNAHDFRTGKTSDTEIATGLNVGMNVVKGKLRGLKIGGKFKSASERFAGSTHASIGNIKGSADIGISFSASNLWENKLYAMASTEASALNVVSKMSLQTRKNRVKADIKAESKVATASASALGGAGMIRYKDENNKTQEGFGVSAELGANAAVYKGSISGGISIMGVRFGGKLSVQALGVGGTAKFTAASKTLSFGLGAALGLGAGFEISIDWSGAIDKFRKWKERKAQRKLLKEKLREDRKKKVSAKEAPADGKSENTEEKEKKSIIL